MLVFIYSLLPIMVIAQIQCGLIESHSKQSEERDSQEIKAQFEEWLEHLIHIKKNLEKGRISAKSWPATLTKGA